MNSFRHLKFNIFDRRDRKAYWSVQSSGRYEWERSQPFVYGRARERFKRSRFWRFDMVNYVIYRLIMLTFLVYILILINLSWKKSNSWLRGKLLTIYFHSSRIEFVVCWRRLFHGVCTLFTGPQNEWKRQESQSFQWPI